MINLKSSNRNSKLTPPLNNNHWKNDEDKGSPSCLGDLLNYDFRDLINKNNNNKGECEDLSTPMIHGAQ